MGFLCFKFPIRMSPLYKEKKGKRNEETYLGSLSKGDRRRKSDATQGGCGQRRKALNQDKYKSINLHILLRRNECRIPIAYPLQEHSRGHDCRRFWRASRSFNDVFLEKALMRSATRSIPMDGAAQRNSGPGAC